MGSLIGNVLKRSAKTESDRYLGGIPLQIFGSFRQRCFSIVGPLVRVGGCGHLFPTPTQLPPFQLCATIQTISWRLLQPTRKAWQNPHRRPGGQRQQRVGFGRRAGPLKSGGPGEVHLPGLRFGCGQAFRLTPRSRLVPIPGRASPFPERLCPS